MNAGLFIAHRSSLQLQRLDNVPLIRYIPSDK